MHRSGVWIAGISTATDRSFPIMLTNRTLTTKNGTDLTQMADLKGLRENWVLVKALGEGFAYSANGKYT